MIHLVRTNSENPDFVALVKHLDTFLAVIDGDDHAFYAQFNKIDILKQAVVAYLDGKPVGCGAIKELDTESMEVKRMYTAPESRGQGVATAILTELENWAAELGYRKCLLETGIRQPEAIALYKKAGYHIIPNYGQYTAVETSVCFEKVMESH